MTTTTTQHALSAGALLSFGHDDHSPTAVQPSNGLVLIEGATGMGRTTLLTTLTAQALALPDTAIVTIAPRGGFALPWLTPAAAEPPIEWAADTDGEALRLLDTLLAIVINRSRAARGPDIDGPDILLLADEIDTLPDKVAAKIETLALIGRVPHVYLILASIRPNPRLARLAATHISLKERGAGHLATRDGVHRQIMVDQLGIDTISAHPGSGASLRAEALATTPGREHYLKRWSRIGTRLFPGRRDS